MTQQQKIEKLKSLIEHIEEVQKNCQKLGFKLIEINEFDLGKMLVANSFLHDQSKFHGLEWLHLTKPDEEDELVGVAIQAHTSANYHHPEAWSGIKNMPPVFLAELVCDWKARSSELGNDLKDWIESAAFKKFQFSKRDKVYRDIMRFVNLLLEPTL
jgi:hypothetical protein